MAKLNPMVTSGTAQVAEPNNLELIKSVLEGMKQRIIDEQRDLKIKASGRSADSLKVVAEQSAGNITGSHYFEYQKKRADGTAGRGPGGFPPLQSILEWIDAKGIEPEGISKKTLAFMIARKIKTQGTNLYMGRRPPDDPIPFPEIIIEGTKQAADTIREGNVNTILGIFRTLKDERNINTTAG